jgi:hypothetical protein
VQHRSGFQRVDADAGMPCLLPQLQGRGTPVRQPPEHVCPALIPGNRSFAEMLPDRGFYRVPAVLIRVPHALEMIHEASVPDELRQRGLFQPGRSVVDEGLQGRCGMDQVARDDHVAEPQARTERSRKGVEIDHATVAVQRLQRREQGAFVAEIGIVVDFQAGGLQSGNRQSMCVPPSSPETAASPKCFLIEDFTASRRF